MASTLSTLLIVGALVAATGFVGFYATTAPWHTSSIGKSMMTLALALVLLTTVALLFNLFGPNYPYRDVIRNLAYAMLNVGLWWHLSILVRVQGRKRRQQECEQQPVELPIPRRSDEAEDKHSVV